MAAETSETDLLNKTTSEPMLNDPLKIHPLHALQMEIANMLDIDPEKVQAAINKIRTGAFGMLGDETQRMASAKRIAQRIIDETQNT